MRSIVTDPITDYIFVTNFDVLAEHLNLLINQACRTEPPSTTSTPTPTLPYCEPGVTGATQPPRGNEYSCQVTLIVRNQLYHYCRCGCFFMNSEI